MRVDVPAGKIHGARYRKGPNSKPFRTIVESEVGKPLQITVEVGADGFDRRSGEHWVASDLHVHMNYAGTYRN